MKTFKESQEDFLAGLDSIDPKRIAMVAYKRWLLQIHSNRKNINFANFSLVAQMRGSIAERIIHTVADENNIPYDILYDCIIHQRIEESKEDFVRGLEDIESLRLASKEAYNTWLDANKIRDIPGAHLHSKIFAQWITRTGSANRCLLSAARKWKLTPTELGEFIRANPSVVK